MGILSGVVMPEMPRIRDFLRDGEGHISRRYTAFTAGDQIVAGLVIPWGRVPGLAKFFGRAVKAERLDTIAKIREALNAGDVLDLEAEGQLGAPVEAPPAEGRQDRHRRREDGRSGSGEGTRRRVSRCRQLVGSGRPRSAGTVPARRSQGGGDGRRARGGRGQRSLPDARLAHGSADAAAERHARSRRRRRCGRRRS